jgi:membrane protein required for beta-lactamase induction
MVEEGIDYDKTPKPMVFLQLSTTFLFISLIVLASVQYSINIIDEENNIEY